MMIVIRKPMLSVVATKRNQASTAAICIAGFQEAALEVIGGKWKRSYSRAIGDDVLRFSELHKALLGINTKMLTRATAQP